jgi:hypothetical protein
VECFNHNDFASALVEFDQALAIRESPYARWDRALALLALGRYPEGFRDYHVVRKIFTNELTELGRHLQARLPPWDGEPDVPVVLLHEAGYGDGVQLSRYVPVLAKQARSVALEVPSPLSRLLAQLAPLADEESEGFCCTIFDLLAIVGATAETIPPPPYLHPDPQLRARWAERIGNGGKRRIGIAWSVKLGSDHEHPNAKREMALDQFLELLDAPGDSALFSLQTQERDEAMAHGVYAFEFDDFADVAAVASLMDEIVSVDTAALHVAGAIGHRNVKALLPYAATWRWRNGCPWYPDMKLCQQQAPGDWTSAFERR